MTCLIAHGAIVLQLAVETPITEQPRSRRVDVADTIVELGSGASHIPHTTFADTTVEHTSESHRAADSKRIVPGMTVVSTAQIDRAAILGFNELDLLAVEIDAEILTVVDGGKVVPFAGIELLIGPSFVVVFFIRV